MSYFGNPSFEQYHQHGRYPPRFGPAPPQPHPMCDSFTSPPPAVLHPFAGFRTSNGAAHHPVAVYDDLEAEEQAALAHLRAVQRRREQAELDIALRARAAAQTEREAAIRHAAEERQAALHSARVEREAALHAAQIEREAALHAAQAARAERENAIRSAIAHHIERKQHHRVALDDARRQAEQERQLAYVARVEAAERQKRDAYEGVARAQKEKYEEWAKAKAVCAARCAAKHAKQEVKKALKGNEEGVNQMTDMLAAMFGFHVVDEDDSTAPTPPTAAPADNVNAPTQPAVNANDVAQQTSEKKVAEKSVKFADKDSVVTPAESTVETAKSTKATFPEDINGLLSQFLGLRVEPLSSDNSTSTNSAVPAGLNEFLGRFGLEFEPAAVDKKEESKQPEASPSAPAVPQIAICPAKPLSAPQATASASQSSFASANDVAPLTNFLNGFTDIPPFVRDILENVEIAFREESTAQESDPKPAVVIEEPVQGKGKGVADGEKRTQQVQPSATEPAVSEESTNPPRTSTSLVTLSSIAHELDLARSSFNFPARLVFTNASTVSTTPALLFNRVNRPYHAQAHKLLQLLLQADSVPSEGDKEIRKKRKQVVSEVEREIEALERKRDATWKEVRERREKGEESEAESESGSSTVDVEHIEHIEHPAQAEHVEQVEQDEQSTEPAVETGEQATEDNRVPKEAGAADRFEEVKTPAEQAVVPVPAKVNEEKVAQTADVKDEAKNDEKDEGYELL